ncbi:uncharacterized protein LOC121892296 [Thunnus maccoyii]|uniref:uncharacterized protein LOC121892296 n=1 Tax=Thunnus maccoyii TaxID=8240 RepID=UPI001C4D94DE|nr:uncharacterized protein LOC121892296 [Thunnus maccoyii]
MQRILFQTLLLLYTTQIFHFTVTVRSNLVVWCENVKKLNLLLRRRHFSTQITARDRVNEFSNDFYADGGVLFCKVRQHSVDYMRRQTVLEHLKSLRHKNRKSSCIVQSRNQTLASCLSKTPSTAEGKEFVLDFTKALLEADIPLEKSPKLAPFLQKQGGSVPAPSHLQSDYLPELFPQYVEDIQRAVKGKAVYVILDETTDACGHCVLAILLQSVGRPPLAADLVFLERVNFTTVSQAVITCLNTYNINFSDVWAFFTDSASYMKKAFNTVLQGLFPNAKQITCLAHVLNLVLEVFLTPLRTLIGCVAL